MQIDAFMYGDVPQLQATVMSVRDSIGLIVHLLRVYIESGCNRIRRWPLVYFSTYIRNHI